MKRRQAVLGLFFAALVALALLTVFAIELSDTQAKSKRDVQTRVHERAVLAAALIDSLFQTVQQQVPKYSRMYGARTVSRTTLDRDVRQNAYLAVLDSSGRVLASSRGFTPQARAALPASASLDLIRAGRPYALGNVVPYRGKSVVNFAVRFPTSYGQRVLLTGFPPAMLTPFLTGELRKIPGVKGAHNYLVDGHTTVIGSTNPKIPAGYRATKPAQVNALSRPFGHVHGRYYDQARLSNSTWRVVLTAPDGPLFASVTGLRKWVPWAVFAAFAFVALAALELGRRALRSAEDARAANARLAEVNDELATANEVLELRARELARSNEDLEQFASVASHDLQEPLRKVRTFTQRVTSTESDRLSERALDYLDRANAAAGRMQTLIEDLLKFSRVTTQRRPFAPVDLTLVTHEVLADLETQIASAGARVHVGELPTISADALQMRQLIQNLISNAVKFARLGVAPEVEVVGSVADGEATISFRDNGIGFEAQYGRRVFGVFERLHGRDQYPGTGIGLALCDKIVLRHGGSIAAESEPGVGSIFTVTLPRIQPGDPPASNGEPLPNGSASRGEPPSELALTGTG